MSTQIIILISSNLTKSKKIHATMQDKKEWEEKHFIIYILKKHKDS